MGLKTLVVGPNTAFLLSGDSSCRRAWPHSAPRKNDGFPGGPVGSEGSPRLAGGAYNPLGPEKTGRWWTRGLEEPRRQPPARYSTTGGATGGTESPVNQPVGGLGPRCRSGRAALQCYNDPRDDAGPGGLQKRVHGLQNQLLTAVFSVNLPVLTVQTSDRKKRNAARWGGPWGMSSTPPLPDRPSSAAGLQI